MVRTKTGKVDAGVIARFCRSQVPELWHPPSPRMRELRVQELQRRAQGAASAMVAASLERPIASLDKKIKLVSDAVTRKLLVIAYGVMKTRWPFETA